MNCIQCEKSTQGGALSGSAGQALARLHEETDDEADAQEGGDSREAVGGDPLDTIGGQTGNLPTSRSVIGITHDISPPSQRLETHEPTEEAENSSGQDCIGNCVIG